MEYLCLSGRNPLVFFNMEPCLYWRMFEPTQPDSVWAPAHFSATWKQGQHFEGSAPVGFECNRRKWAFVLARLRTIQQHSEKALWNNGTLKWKEPMMFVLLPSDSQRCRLMSYTFQFQGGNGSSPVRGLPPVIRSPQNSHSHSAQGTTVSFALVMYFAAAFGILPSPHQMLSPLLQISQNSSSPTSLSFGDHMTQPKQLAVRCVQVRWMPVCGPVSSSV